MSSRGDSGRSRRAAAPGAGGGLDQRRAVFMISVAAELAEMHPQTLRMYEARGLISPKRSAKNTRLYSLADVDRLRRIQRMTVEEGLNLAGVETVLGLEAELARARAELGRMRKRASEIERRMLDEIERVKRSFRAEIVPYGAYDSTVTKRVRIPVEPQRRPRRGASDGEGREA